MLHGGILCQDDGTEGNLIFPQQIQKIRNIVAAVGGAAFQKIGLQPIACLQIGSKDPGFRQSCRLNIREFLMDPDSQRFRGMAGSACNDVLFRGMALHRLGQYIAAAQNAAAKQHHNVCLIDSVSFL